MSSTLIQPKKRGARNSLKRLTPSQLLFVEALKADRQFNPTSAARAAGYAVPSQAANKLMKNPIIKAAVGRALYERQRKFEVTAERVLQELAAIAFFDPRKLVDECGLLLEMKDLPGEVAAAIQSLKVLQSPGDGDSEATRVIDYKFWNKVEALTLLVRHLGLEAPTRVETEHKMTLDWDSLSRPIDSEVDRVEVRVQKLVEDDSP